MDLNSTCIIFIIGVLLQIKCLDSQELDVESRSSSDVSLNLLCNYVPVCIQALIYYSELLQYEPLLTTTLEPPFTGDAAPTQAPMITTTSAATTTTTTPATATTSTTTTRAPPTKPVNFADQPYSHATKPHKPSIYAPKPPATSKRPLTQLEVIENSKWNEMNMQFTHWFFQNKTKITKPIYKYNLELLDKLPKEIYINQANELPELPALLDEDNVNEFRRLYDDGYNRVIRSGSTGNKRIPPTKPFVEMLILLDLLKREAKQAMLNMYHGYCDRVVYELQETRWLSAARQLHFILSKILDNKETDKRDIVARMTSLREDLANPYSITAKSLEFIEPLQFLPL